MSTHSDEVEGRGFSWWSLSWRLGTGLTWGTDSIRQRYAALPMAWCGLLLAGTSWSLFRLLLGLWGVRDCRRKSVAIRDPDVLALVDSLRVSLGMRRGIEVRELRGLSTAAAVGWKRPLVLVPGDWRNWNNTERRAVLAHELAHIARADYAVGVVARLGVALHFYHPLVHCMVGRLQLQQELAADAEGARLAGGRRAYLCALSRLALGLDTRRPAWPATAFLPRSGHLIRRIEMLNEQVPVSDGTMPTAARAITIAVFVAIGLAAAAVRGPSPIEAAEASPGTDKNTSNPVNATPTTSNARSFDLTYLPSKAIGFVAVKPAAIAQLPACKPQLDRLNALLAKEFPRGMPKIEDIEQATVEYSVRARDRSKKQMGRIMTGAFMVRTVKDFDWKTAIKAFVKRVDNADLEFVEVRLDGHVYFKSAKSRFPRPFGPDAFYFPDARTLVWDNEDHLRSIIGQAKRSGPEFVAGDDWRKVDGGLIALGMDTRDNRWKLDVSTDEPQDLAIAPLLQQPSRWVLGIDGADSLILHAIATCETDAKGQLLARTAEALLARGRVAFGQMKTSAPKGDAADIEAGAMRLANEFIQASIVHCAGSAVDINATGHSNADSLMALILGVVGG